MKNIMYVIIAMLSIFTFSFTRVEAKTIEIQRKFDNTTTTNTNNNTTTVNYLEDKGDYANCNGLLTADAVDMIRELLNYFRILAPMALLLFTALDFGQAVISQEKDALSKAGSKVAKRAIATVALFFIPTIVRVILGLDGVRDAIQIPDDPLCQTMNSNTIEIIEM